MWLEKRDAPSWYRKLIDFMSVRYLTPEPSSFSAQAKEFFLIFFYIYVIGYLECSILAKSDCISAYVAAGKFAHNSKSKVDDRSRGQPEGSLFNSYYTEVWGRALLLSLDCSTLPLIRALYCWVLSKEASSTIFKVFDTTRPGIEHSTHSLYIYIYIVIHRQIVESVRGSPLPVR